MNKELDQDVVNLAKAIRQTESGGDFSAKGKSGEHGGYQYTPSTWDAVAPKYGIKSKLDQATPEEQNAVTYNRIKEWKDKGHDVTQIASMWNAGEGEPDAYKGKFGRDTGTHKAGDPSTGVNSYGARYDVPAYAKSVSSAYLAIKNGGNVAIDPQNPSSVIPPGTRGDDGFVRTANVPQSQVGAETPNNTDKKVGKVQGLVQGVASPFLKMASNVRAIGDIAKADTNEEINNARTKEYDYGYFGKQKPTQGVKDALVTGAKAGSEIASVIGGAGLLKNVVTGTPKILKGPAVKEVSKLFRMSVDEIGSLSKADQVNLFEEALKRGGNELPAMARREIQHVIQKLLPLADREVGLAPGLLKSVASKGGKLGWKALKALPGLAGVGSAFWMGRNSRE